MTRKELLAKVQSGDVTADTLVWREGLDDWRPLRNVAELGDMLRAGAQKLSGSLLDEMGRLYLETPLGLGLVHTQDMALAADAVEANQWQPEAVQSASLALAYGFEISPAIKNKENK